MVYRASDYVIFANTGGEVEAYNNQNYLVDGLYSSYFKKINDLDLQNYYKGANDFWLNLNKGISESETASIGQQKNSFVNYMLNNDNNFNFSDVINKAVKNINIKINSQDPNAISESINVAGLISTNLKKENSNDKIVNFLALLLSRMKVINNIGNINNENESFYDFDYAYNNQWANFVKSQFYNLYYQGFSTDKVKTDKGDLVLNPEKYIIDTRFFNETNNKMKLNYFLNPFVQINNMIYGTNYINNFNAELLNFNVEFGTMININFKLKINTLNQNTTFYSSLISSFINKNLIYIIYTIFMIAGCSLLSLKFSRLIRP